MANLEAKIIKESYSSILEKLVLRRLKPGEMHAIADNFGQTIEKRLQTGLSIPTFLKPPPEDLTILEGKKTIAMEVGGTNMRAGIGQITNGQFKFEETTKGQLKDKIGDKKTKFNSVDDFFDNLFQALPKLADWIRKNQNLPLSIIFSFPGKPVEREGSLDCKIEALTKEFEIPGMIGSNFGELLNKYLTDHKIIKEGEKRQVVIFNDTPILVKKDLGMVVGSGYNFAIKMKVGDLRKLKGADFAKGWKEDEKMIVNLEAGGLDLASSYFYDKKNNRSILYWIDHTSQRLGGQLDEKQISGDYLGKALQIALTVLNHTIDGVDVNLDKVKEWKADYLSYVLDKNWGGLPFQAPEKDYDKITEICEILENRSAQIVASHLAGAGKMLGLTEITVTTEGSVFWKMPGYKELVEIYAKGLGIQANFEAASEGELASLERGAINGLNYFTSER